MIVYFLNSSCWFNSKAKQKTSQDKSVISVNVKANKVSINAEHVNLGKHSIEIKKILSVGQDALITRHIRYGRTLRHSYSGRIIIISEDTKFTVTPASN